MSDPLDMMDQPAQVTREFILCYLCSLDAPKLSCDVCYGRGKMIKVPRTDDIYPRFIVTITSRLSGTITCRGVIGHSELDTGPLFSVMYSDGATESWPIDLLSGIKVHPNGHGEQKVKRDEPQPAPTAAAAPIVIDETWIPREKPEQEIQAGKEAVDKAMEAIKPSISEQLTEILFGKPEPADGGFDMREAADGGFGMREAAEESEPGGH